MSDVPEWLERLKKTIAVEDIIEVLLAVDEDVSNQSVEVLDRQRELVGTGDRELWAEVGGRIEAMREQRDRLLGIIDALARARGT